MGQDPRKAELQDPSSQVICRPAFPTYQHQRPREEALTPAEGVFLLKTLHRTWQGRELFFLGIFPVSWYLESLQAYSFRLASRILEVEVVGVALPQALPQTCRLKNDA